VTALEGLARDDTASMLAGARVLLGRMLIEMGQPAAAEPILSAALQWLDRLGPEHPQRAEAACELARARTSNLASNAASKNASSKNGASKNGAFDGAHAEGLSQLRQCLPIYRSWGLAEREVLTALERLTATSPAPSSTNTAGST
jgi:hypothetical protein